MKFDSISTNPALMDFSQFFYDMVIYIMYKRWVLKNHPLSMDEAIALTARLLKDGVPPLKK